MERELNEGPRPLKIIDVASWAGQPIPPRKPWDNYPYGCQSTRKVECRFQRLGKVVWQGEQWAVTSRGLEARNGRYVIAKDRLWENWETGSWEAHMSVKGWVNVPEFRVAIAIARDHHRKFNPLIKKESTYDAE